MLKALILITALALAAGPVPAETGKTSACVKYLHEDGTWSQSFRVNGLIVMGDYLKDWARDSDSGFYSDYDFYFVLPWKRREYAAFAIGEIDTLPVDFQRVQDQGGKTWLVRRGWENCGYSGADGGFEPLQ